METVSRKFQIKRNLRKGILSLIFISGYFLSPASWWNDAVVNLPLAWLAASVAELVLPCSFQLAVIVCYWASNLAGILMMLWSGHRLLGIKREKRFEIVNAVTISILYTIIVYFLLRLQIISPLHF